MREIPSKNELIAFPRGKHGEERTPRGSGSGRGLVKFVAILPGRTSGVGVCHGWGELPWCADCLERIAKFLANELRAAHGGAHSEAAAQQAVQAAVDRPAEVYALELGFDVAALVRGGAGEAALSRGLELRRLTVACCLLEKVQCFDAVVADEFGTSYGSRRAVAREDAVERLFDQAMESRKQIAARLSDSAFTTAGRIHEVVAAKSIEEVNAGTVQSVGMDLAGSQSNRSGDAAGPRKREKQAMAETRDLTRPSAHGTAAVPTPSLPLQRLSVVPGPTAAPTPAKGELRTAVLPSGGARVQHPEGPGVAVRCWRRVKEWCAKGKQATAMALLWTARIGFCVCVLLPLGVVYAVVVGVCLLFALGGTESAPMEWQ